MVRVAYEPIYKYNLPNGHRFPMEKYELLPQQLLYEGTLQHEHFFEPSALAADVLHQTHHPSYTKRLWEGSLSTKEIKRIGFPLRQELLTRGMHISQGTIDCACWALQNGVALNIAGGTHHAFADRGEGFCVFNDFAIAANFLIGQRLAEKILIVDLDVHQGNGTASIFRAEKRVFTFSMHGAKNYPLRKEKSDLDVPLPDHTRDDLYLKTLSDTLPQLMSDQKPDLLLYLAGADVIAADALGRLDLTIQGAKERDAIVFEQGYRHGVPIAVSMGGGYAPRVKDIIEVHANTFRLAVDAFG